MSTGSAEDPYKQVLDKNIATSLFPVSKSAFDWNKLLLVLCFVNNMAFSHI